MQEKRKSTASIQTVSIQKHFVPEGKAVLHEQPKITVTTYLLNSNA